MYAVIRPQSSVLPRCLQMWLPIVKLMFPNALQVEESRLSVSAQTVKQKKIECQDCGICCSVLYDTGHAHIMCFLYQCDCLKSQLLT